MNTGQPKRKRDAAMKQYVDLHLHSTWSDGIHSPAKLVAMAAANGMRAIALADHDSVDGIDEAIDAGARHNVEVIAAVELSVEFRKFKDVHLLSYLIDHRDAGLRKKLAEFRQRRIERGHAIIDRINLKLSRQGKGCLSHADLSSREGGALGRPHIARILVERGLVRDVQEAFENYLVPCNMPKEYFPMAEALAETRRIGGISVLAHPQSIATDRRVLREMFGELAEMGLDGLEVFNNMCYDDDIIFLENCASALDLVMTGGSDFHGFEDDVAIGAGRGGLAVAYHLVDAMKKRQGRYLAPSP